jgi:hypothetical protein
MADKKIDYATVFAAGLAAANEAFKAATPTPMIVKDGRSGQTWHVAGGVCGFAWVHVTDRKFANYLKKENIGHKNYRKGWDVWMGRYCQTQSMETLQAGASAMSRVFNEAGIECYADSRMD